MPLRSRFAACGLLALLLVLPSAGVCATYRDEVNGFSLDAPAFEPVTSGASQALTLAGPQIDGAAPNCNVQIQIANETLEGYEKLTLAQFEQFGLTMLEASRVTASGQPALRWHYTGKMRGVELEWLALVTARENRFYLLTCTARRSAFERVRKAFEATVASFSVD